MYSRQSKYSPQKVKGLETSLQAGELRKQGYSYPQIAEELCMSLSGARKAVERWFKQSVAELSEPIEELRELEVSKLNDIEARLNSTINDSAITDMERLKYIDALMKVKDRKYKLLGLNAPQKQEI